ncbi:N-acylneuraminate-9-phosphatase-like [Ctenocephalides felis]|uniref:N-acylneuraminate-9-phosphatase-like n=1 Tax=Ctenocephalides felis TaxID=7515 RepID=UPI000E6E5257|nr:N-acylneuraminate-9-phosphatase-like [Ctenocephalides felis]XP_026480329.1 N-acylneuraminate-9-phosphatase-like [Ctenocephalides felis]
MAASRAQKQNAISALFFDLDNTLIPTRKADTLACMKIAELLHDEHNISREQASLITQNYVKSFRLCPDNLECDLNTWRCHLWSKSLTEQYNHLTQRVYLKWLQLRYYYLSIDDNVRKMLISLRKQYLLGLITNGPSSAQWEKVERLNLTSLFDCIIVSGDLPWAKPDQKIFLEACKYLGVEPKRCVMIGDKLETDIQGGIEAELGLTIWLPLDKNCVVEHESIQPDFTISNILELPQILPPAGLKSAAYRSRAVGNHQLQNGDKSLNYLQNRRMLSMPEFEDCNSNSSDGS